MITLCYLCSGLISLPLCYRIAIPHSTVIITHREKLCEVELLDCTSLSLAREWAGSPTSLAKGQTFVLCRNLRQVSSPPTREDNARSPRAIWISAERGGQSRLKTLGRYKGILTNSRTVSAQPLCSSRTFSPIFLADYRAREEHENPTSLRGNSTPSC